ncbi:MAG: hypothetical protein LC126_01145 [Bryobacterales bacterium]|nr:hypothetical protein [Bryobacterales bacterium]
MSARLDRIEAILESVAKRQDEMTARQEEAAKRHAEAGRDIDRRLAEMAARQQYHDEALERMDTRIRQLITALEMDAANIRSLANVAAVHERRLSDLEGDATT